MLVALVTFAMLGAAYPTASPALHAANEYRLKVIPDAPSFRFELRVDSKGNPIELACYPSGTATPRQVLPIFRDAVSSSARDLELDSPSQHDFLTAADINNDGFPDLRVLAMKGATGNVLVIWYLWDSRDARFRRAPEFDVCSEALKNGCCQYHWNWDVAEFERKTYCVRSGKLVAVHSLSQRLNKRLKCLERTERTLTHGTWVTASRCLP